MSEHTAAFWTFNNVLIAYRNNPSLSTSRTRNINRCFHDFFSDEILTENNMLIVFLTDPTCEFNGSSKDFVKSEIASSFLSYAIYAQDHDTYSVIKRFGTPDLSYPNSLSVEDISNASSALFLSDEALLKLRLQRGLPVVRTNVSSSDTSIPTLTIPSLTINPTQSTAPSHAELLQMFALNLQAQTAYFGSKPQRINTILSKTDAIFQSECFNVQTLFTSPQAFRNSLCTPVETGTQSCTHFSTNLAFAVSTFQNKFFQCTTSDRPKLSDAMTKNAFLFNFHDVKILAFVSPSFFRTDIRLRIHNAFTNLRTFFQPFGNMIPAFLLELEQNIESLLSYYKLIDVDLLLESVQDQLFLLHSSQLRFNNPNILDSNNDDSSSIDQYVIDTIRSHFYIDSNKLSQILFNSDKKPSNSFTNERKTGTDRKKELVTGTKKIGTIPKQWFLDLPKITGVPPCFHWISQKDPCCGPICKSKKTRPHLWDASTTPAEKVEFETYVQQGWT